MLAWGSLESLASAPPFGEFTFGEMVRLRGLEPPHIAVLEPKSSASTSSATAARVIKKLEGLVLSRPPACYRYR